MTVPDDPRPYDDPHRSLWAAVDIPRRVPAATVVATMRAAYDLVIAPALAVRDVPASLLAFPVGADLARARSVPELAWEVALRNEPLEGVHAVGTLPEGVRLPSQHGGRVFKIDADFPVTCRRPDGTPWETPLVVGFSVVQGALRGGGANEGAQQAAFDWLAETVERLDAVTGFATVDFVSSFASGPSPYEAAAQVIRTGVDPTRQVRGYQWLTVLGTEHVGMLGGPEAVEGAPVEEVHRLSDGRFLLRLARDACGIGASQLAALRSFLAPLLPEGLTLVGQESGGVPYRLVPDARC